MRRAGPEAGGAGTQAGSFGVQRCLRSAAGRRADSLGAHGREADARPCGDGTRSPRPCVCLQRAPVGVVGAIRRFRQLGREGGDGGSDEVEQAAEHMFVRVRAAPDGNAGFGPLLVPLQQNFHAAEPEVVRLALGSDGR